MTTQPIDVLQYLFVHRAHGPFWSPDGTQLAFVADMSGVDQGWILNVKTQEQRQFTYFPDRVGLIAWSPCDQQMIVTVDAGGNEHDQLYLVQFPGGETRPLTNAPHVIHHFGAWSPDGRSICYSSNQRHPAFFDVWVMNILSRETSCVLQQDASLMPVAWSPDGTVLLIRRLNTALDQDLLLVPLGGQAPRLLTFHEGEAAYEAPVFSPDGQNLYVLTNYQREFLAPACLDLGQEAMPLAHTPLTLLTETTWDAEAGIAMSQDGKKLAWALNENGCSRIVLYDREHAQELPAPFLPPGVVEGLTWSPQGTEVAFSFNATRFNGNIWVASPGIAKSYQVSAIPMELDQSSLVEPELIHYASFDGRLIPAYYYRPQQTARATASGLLPVIIFVHGGPESQFRPLYAAPWMPPLQYYLHRGFAVLAPNVRGSLGYGKTYVHLDDVQLRPDSVADLKAGVQWIIEHCKADPKRIGIMGRSYGGYMVLAAITTYPDLWAAAVDMVGIANFVSFLEQTGPWRRTRREAEYGSLTHHRDVLEQISPIHAIDCITTPLQVLHGANDPRVPVSEAEHIVAALRAKQVPVHYLRFEDEGHFMLRHSTQLIAYPAIGDWFERYMG